MHARTFISGYILSAVEMRIFRLRFERAGSSVENAHVPTLADCGLESPRAVKPCIPVVTRQILKRYASTSAPEPKLHCGFFLVALLQR